MSAPLQKIGILAGGGIVPQVVTDSCCAQGMEVFVIGFEGQADTRIANVMCRLGAAGKAIKTLKAQNIQDLILIGSIRRPSLMDLRPDWVATKFLMTHGYSALGDDAILTKLREFLEERGFRVHGVHQVVPDLLTPEGVLGAVSTEGHEENIRIGMKAAQNLGRRDIGQAVIVRDGNVIAEEDLAGTDTMIRSVDAEGGVLVKMCKPQQDPDLDLPTIGLETIQNAVKAGIVGIAVQAGASLFVQRNEALKLADEAGVFVVGVDG